MQTTQRNKNGQMSTILLTQASFAKLSMRNKNSATLKYPTYSASDGMTS